MVIAPEVWGLLSVALAVISLVPYLWTTLKGNNRPHLFTWIIWTLLTGIAFAVQFSSGAASGAWPTGVTCLLCAAICAASLRGAEKNITRSDWVTFLLALAAIPLWLMTDNPSIAAIWVTAIDGLGYVPTYRKVWSKPFEEMVFTHIMANIKHGLSLLALGVVSIPTAFYPVALIVFNCGLIAVIMGRRYVSARTT